MAQKRLRRVTHEGPQHCRPSRCEDPLTNCPSCLQGLKRDEDDLDSGPLEADYIVVEMARLMLGENWLPDYVAKANSGGIERVLV